MYAYRHIYTGTPLFNGKTADICIYSYMYIHICIYEYVYTYMYIYTARPSSLYTHICIYIYVYTYLYRHAPLLNYACINMYIYWHAPFQRQDCRWTPAHVYIYVYIQAYTSSTARLRYTARKASWNKAGVEPVHQYRPRLTKNWFSGSNPKCFVRDNGTNSTKEGHRGRNPVSKKLLGRYIYIRIYVYTCVNTGPLLPTARLRIHTYTNICIYMYIYRNALFDGKTAEIYMLYICL